MEFSVLMSVYYREKQENLEKALNSILVYQTLKPSEVVIVKDGPLTKQLDDVIEKFMKRFQSRIKIVDFKKNQGLGYALKEGLKMCKYEVVARMDTDDISLENRFQEQIDYMSQGYDVVGANIYEFEENEENIVRIKITPENHEDILKFAKRRNPINHPVVMFRKSSVLKAGNYLECLLYEDYYLWIRMLKMGMKFYNIQQPLLKFRAGEDMIKRRSGINCIKYEIDFFKKMKKLNFINNIEFISNITLRLFVRAIPYKSRRYTYNKFLRTNKGC